MRPVADLEKPIDLSFLRDRSVLVTGGVSGIGKLTATEFAKHNALVTVADINEELGKRFVEESRDSGIRINFVKTDVTDWNAQVHAFKSAIKFSGNNSIDVVVAVAGLAGGWFTAPEEDPPSLDTDPPQPPLSAPIFDVNAKGVYFTTKLAQHYFALQSTVKAKPTSTPRKSLILISSLAGYLETNAADYTASKWAVRGLFRSVRSKMEDLGYRTNLIAPWVMDTPMSKGLAEVCRKQGFPVGDARQVAQTVVRCATDDSICGRAVAVGATNAFDLGDDIEGMNAGTVMKSYLEGEAKKFMAFFGQRP